ncbi:phosphate metabolism protein 7 [Vanrija albida]|uniref:Phosphate metabolism protein 7 n=1 Tax=Vanrija albida TaxID=181172 RepID=A0ABR3QEG5_9TREE
MAEGDQADKAQSATTSQFTSALVTAAITVGVCLLFWLIFHSRKSLVRVFQPRTTDIKLAEERPETLPDNPVSWWRRVFSLDDFEVLELNGPDAYFFIRYIKVFGVYMLIPYTIIAIAALVPATVVKPNEGKSGVQKMTLGNIPNTAQLRLITHIIVAVILISWTLYLLVHEYNHYLSVRETWLRSPKVRAQLKSRTVALMNVPADLNNVEGIKEIAAGVAASSDANYPRPSGVTVDSPTTAAPKSAGGVTDVWVGKKVGDVEKVWNKRDKAIYGLEGTVGKAISKALKNERKGKTPEKLGTLDTDRAGATLLDKYLAPKKQPTWRPGFFKPKIALDGFPEYIHSQDDQLQELRAKDDYKEGDVSFVRFATQDDALNFARLAAKSNKSFNRVRTSINVPPEDIVWSNTNIGYWQRLGRTIVSWSLTIGLIIVWAIPVAFVGTISNLDALCKDVSWLRWICTEIPAVPLGIIKGILPPVLLSVLMMLLPIVLRLWIKLQGEIRQSEIELKLFTRYWLFQVIHSFLIMTLSGGIIDSLGDLLNGNLSVAEICSILATRLPGASTFFLTWIMVVSWSGAAQSLARVVPFVMYQLRGFLAGNTPRKVFGQTFSLGSFLWSTAQPVYCLVVCVTVVYSVIQPLITVLGLVTMIILYAAYKYLLIWTADQPGYLETGGLYYIKAMRTVFVALYFTEICLAGLFFLMTDAQEKRSKVGLAGGAIVVVMGIITAVTQAWIDHIGFKRQTILYGRSANGQSSSQTNLNQLSEKLTVTSNDLEDPETAGDDGIVHDFDNPAMWKAQPVVWLSNDPLGIGNSEAERLNDQGIPASTEYAIEDVKAKIEVARSPPDEKWTGGI